MLVPGAVLLSDGRPGRRLPELFTLTHHISDTRGSGSFQYRICGGRMPSLQTAVVRLAGQQPAVPGCPWKPAFGLQVRAVHRVLWHSASVATAVLCAPNWLLLLQTLPALIASHCKPRRWCCCSQRSASGPLLVVGAASGVGPAGRAAVLDDLQQELLDAMELPTEWATVGGTSLCPVPPGDRRGVLTGGDRKVRLRHCFEL